MDMSKLPRLSNTANAQQAASQDPAAATPQSPDAPPTSPDIPTRAVSNPPRASMIGAEVWISLILGVIFCYMGWNFARWGIATLTHQPYHTNVKWTAGPKDGQEVDYLELTGHQALSDSAVLAFGVALILEAAVLAFAMSKRGMRRGLVAFALITTVLVTAYNLFAIVKLFSEGLPIISLLAVAFGGYIAMYESAMLKSGTTEI
jgi:hypothetical protein